MEERCIVCGSEDVIQTGPLTITGSRATVSNITGKQCTLCGNLQVMIPQLVLLRLYPPEIRQLTYAQRQRLQMRRKMRRVQKVHG